MQEYLLTFYDKLAPKDATNRAGRKPGPYKWYEIQDNVAYYKDFEKDKIVWIELTDKPNFAYDDKKYYPNNTIFFMTGGNLMYLLGFLNSRLCEWYFDKIAATSGVGTRRWIKMYIDQIHIPLPIGPKSELISAAVEQLLGGESLPDHLISELDIKIFDLLDLSQSEIEFILTANI